jgi:hypothetical protein
MSGNFDPTKLLANYQHRFSSTPGVVVAPQVAAEITLNLKDLKAYTKREDGSVVELFAPGAKGDTGANGATGPKGAAAWLWAHFNGITGAIKASSGVSSVTRNSIGNYSVGSILLLPSANYAVALSAGTSGGATRLTVMARSDTGVQVQVENAAGQPVDVSDLSVAIIRS